MNYDDDDDDEHFSRNKFQFLLKAFFILVLLFGFRIVEVLLWGLTFIQFFYKLFTGKNIKYIKDFSISLGKWNYYSIRFCLGDDIEAPFPFSQWPSNDEIE